MQIWFSLVGWICVGHRAVHIVGVLGRFPSGIYFTHCRVLDSVDARLEWRKLTRRWWRGMREPNWGSWIYIYIHIYSCSEATDLEKKSFVTIPDAIQFVGEICCQPHCISYIFYSIDKYNKLIKFDISIPFNCARNFIYEYISLLDYFRKQRESLLCFISHPSSGA